MLESKKNILIGAHMSIAGGLEQAIIRGNAIGCNVIQIFLSNNRQWKTKEITQEQQELFTATLTSSSIETVVAHARYLINLGSPYPETQMRSINTLIEELNLCAMLRIPFLIIHPGSHLFLDVDTCLRQIALNIDHVLESGMGNAMLLLETMAGQGSTVCSTFEQIGKIRQLSKYPHRIGVCLDTCHIFAAGYDFRDYHAYKDLLSTFDNTIGLKHIKVLHINDSKKILGSRVDRHEHIGKGKIGLEAFSFLCNDPLFLQVPKILETPKASATDDIQNMNQIKKLII